MLDLRMFRHLGLVGSSRHTVPELRAFAFAVLGNGGTQYSNCRAFRQNQEYFIWDSIF